VLLSPRRRPPGWDATSDPGSVEPHDPLTLVLTGGGLCLVALGANALAARRSTRASPALALQSDW